MESPSTSDKRRAKSSPKMKFTKEEDESLKQVIEMLKTDDWKEVAKYMPGRNSRQCRERWNNYVNPKLEPRKWTPEEDKMLLQKVDEYGNKWHSIATFFDGRATNNIKNRYMTLQRKANKIKKDKNGSKLVNIEDQSPKKPNAVPLPAILLLQHSQKHLFIPNCLSKKFWLQHQSTAGKSGRLTFEYSGVNAAV